MCGALATALRRLLPQLLPLLNEVVQEPLIARHQIGETNVDLLEVVLLTLDLATQFLDGLVVEVSAAHGRQLLLAQLRDLTFESATTIRLFGASEIRIIVLFVFLVARFTLPAVRVVHFGCFFCLYVSPNETMFIDYKKYLA